MTVLDQSSPVVNWTDRNELKGKVYECRAWLWPEDDGGYSAIVPSLPGVASQGETQEEALDNIKEAFQGVVTEYIDSGEEIPWRHDIVRQKPLGVTEKWILVNV